MQMQRKDEAREYCWVVGKGINKAVEECSNLGLAKSTDAHGFFGNIQQQLNAA